jgi:hypothetical protein
VTITTGPVPVPPAPGDVPGAGGISDDFELWEHEHDTLSAGGCLHPVRLTGQIAAVDLKTGELRPVFDTNDLPGGVLLTGCGNRRETVCPACSQTYKRDARQLVRAGLTGGKGVPETIGQHPCVFATLTAPSFGPVHARRMRGSTVLPCRPRRDAKQRRCSHGRDISCPRRHGEHDPVLGRALCHDCYDYTAAVLFNAHAGELWRRFTTYLPRYLARRTGLTVKAFRELAAVRYVKVAEYQARGVVHFHAVIRLDARARDDDGQQFEPPPRGWLTAAHLVDAIVQAAAAVTITTRPDDDNPRVPALRLRFGPQTDARIIRYTGQLTARAVGNYIAKYATKTLDAPGLPDRPVRTRVDLNLLHCPRHYKAMMLAAWQLSPSVPGPADRYRRWVHMLGFGGHCLTKSRRYSVTFGQLRRARTDHQRATRHPEGETDPWGRPVDDSVVLIVKAFEYAGTGHQCRASDGAALALASADQARAHADPAHAANGNPPSSAP